MTTTGQPPGRSGRQDGTLRVRLERDPTAPSLARAAVSGFSREREISPKSLDTLALLVSELVSNAVLHSDAPAGSEIRLSARLVGRDAIRVEVTDQGSGFAATPRDPARQEGGYGLFLVESQASSWGIERSCGTRVWFEIAGHRPPDSEPR
jgi:anti-sigma regulatory factor (Ser/Thr protein kinase)